MTTAGSPPATADTALTLAGVSKYYGDVAALVDLSFELKRGEFLTMLGPSGSGKTTTLRIIAGFVAPSSGTVKIHGRDVVDVPPNARNIGMVFQDYALFPHMTVSANIGYPLETRRVPKAERMRRVMEMLEVVGLANLADRYPRELSGGQQQRVALARALVFGPDIVLLDEPMAALDKKLRSSMQLEVLRIVKKLGATVISVTHDQEEALVMSDRIGVFDQGRLVQIGTPMELYESPRTEFVADFVGEANLLCGDVSIEGDRCVIRGAGWIAALKAGDARAARVVAGQTVSLVLRPEAIRVEAADGRAVQPNRCAAVVLEKIYLGVEYRLLVRLEGGEVIQVRARDTRHLANVAVGERVTLSWDEADLVLITP
ncbi:MAG: ABC transporter ATP-binding protein [Rhodospirillaceae bacterium]|nr:ABC transporter ATP-binding protein [Rhodospirillaceae bacterium]